MIRYSDPNSSIGNPPNPNTHITISNASDHSIQLGKSHEVIDRGDGVGYVTAPKSFAETEANRAIIKHI